MTYQIQTPQLGGAPGAITLALPAPVRGRFSAGERRAWRRRRRARALRQALSLKG